MKIFIRIITFIIFICLLAACNGNDPASQDRLERMRALHSGRTYEDPEKGFQEVYERDEADRMENIILWNDREDGTLPVSEFYDHIYVENIGDEDFSYGDTQTRLEFFDNGKWYTFPYPASMHLDVGHMVSPGEKYLLVFAFDLDKLEVPGHYRIVLENLYFSEEANRKWREYVDTHDGKYPQFEFIAEIAELKWTAIEVDVIDE